MARAKISQQPSPYPSTVFHSIRVAQFLSSVIVTSFLGFFVYHLNVEFIQVPWTFILLLAVSTFTISSILATSVLHYTRTLKAGLNASINGFLSLLWLVGFGLLGWNVIGTLMHQCTIENWDHEAGVMVCRIYKALLTFTITGLVSTLAALLLDVRTLHQSRYRGKYNPMLDEKMRQHVVMETLHDSSYREPSLEFPEYSHEVKKPYKVQRPIEAQHFGYSAPSEQTAYDGPGGAMHGGYGNGNGF